MGEAIIYPDIAKPEYKIKRAGISATNSVRVFRSDGYSVRLQIRLEKGYATAALDKKQVADLIEALSREASQITLDKYGKPLN